MQSFFAALASYMHSMLNWPEATIFQGIERIASGQPDEVATQFRGERTTYAELIAESRALAHGLAELGVSEDDRIAVWLSNRPEWIKTQLAASYLGAAIVAVNTRYRTHELEYMMRNSSCSVLVTEESFLGNQYLSMIADVVPEIQHGPPREFQSEAIPSLEGIITLTPHDDFPAARVFEDVQSRGQGRDELGCARDARAPACVFYTSGTTSDPKGVLQSNRSLLNHSFEIGNHMGLHRRDICLGLLPFCGVWGYNTFLTALTHGIPQVVQTHFDAAQTIKNVERHGVTYMPGLAIMYQRMINDETFSTDRVRTLSKASVGFIGMGYDEDVFKAIERQTGINICQPYGLSEGNSQIFMGDPDDPVEIRKRVGGPMVFAEGEQIRIIDPDSNEPCPDGEVGEICLQGYNVTDRYLDKPDQTEAAFDENGWFHTGDLGLRDAENGYIYYQSRMDDALRIRGFLVAPREIETIITEHVEIEAAQVVGAPHPRHGEVAVAFLKARNNAVGSSEIAEFLQGRVADYKQPEAIEFISEFPRSAGPHGDKIRKNELRDRVSDRYVG